MPKLDLCSELVSRGFLKGTKPYRREYNRLYRKKILRASEEYKNREREKNRKRYHEKYKIDPEYKERQRQNWQRYSKQKGPQWQKLRSKKYRKTYSEMSEWQRFKIREAYKKWAKENWEWRVNYARKYRQKVDPTVGLKAIISAVKRGELSVGELVEEFGRAIIRVHEEDS